jgi:predicted oxidoreductase
VTGTIAPPAPFRLLGRNDMEVSSIAWGMWRFLDEDLRVARGIVDAALTAGITLFDTADIYGEHLGFGAAESLLGRVLRDAPSLRKDMVIATKGGIRPGFPYDSSPAWLADAIDGSLQRIGIERIDLYQIHRPDLLAHPQEVARALEDAHRAGKIRAIGVSNYSPAQVDALASASSLPLVCQQIEFSPLCTAPLADGTLDQAMAKGMAVLAWSPLAGGALVEPHDEKTRAVAALLDAAADEAGVGRAAAACAWLMAHPSRPIPIIGTQNVEHIASAADAYRVRWRRADWYRVLETSRGQALP